MPVELETVEVAMLKPANVDSAGTMTLAGVEAILGFELDNVTVAPPLGAGPLRTTEFAVVTVPLVTVFGVRLTADSCAGANKLSENGRDTALAVDVRTAV